MSLTQETTRKQGKKKKKETLCNFNPILLVYSNEGPSNGLVRN